MANQPKRNFYAEYEKEITSLCGAVPTLLLHSCCAPCSSTCLERLCEFFHVTVFYYNPNITARDEYRKRKEEQIRLIGVFNSEIETGTRKGYPIEIRDCEHDPESFLTAARGLEQCPERGERCTKCFELRLGRTAREAAGVFDFFATTLTLSPLKDATLLNTIGEVMGERYGARYLVSDFKKKEGYKRSLAYSEKYDLYRQDFCGCSFSKAERERQKQNAASDGM